MKLEIGNKVIKNNKNDFNGIGEIVDINNEGKVEVSWSNVKCEEDEKELLLVVEDDGKVNNGEYYKDVEKGDLIRIEGIRLRPNFGHNQDGKKGSKMMPSYITSSKHEDKKIIEDTAMVEYIKSGKMIKVQIDEGE